MSHSLWFKDAIIYELHVKTFHDSDGDGVGDLRGLIEKIDYFAELGVTAIWLLPFYPSPLRDDGYDIADYTSVHPSYGTLEDFKTFLDAAHERGLRVITELVLNHTSDQNPWFQRARRAPVGSVERDYYVWSDDPKKYREARIIFKDFETSNWTYDPVAKSYFWHRFYSHQPDLNFDNPAVHDDLLRVMDFWLELGVDGVRLDAVPYLYEREGTNCENLPETLAFLSKLRAHIDAKFDDRMLLAEANQWPEDSAAYFGTGERCQMNFHFPLMPRMFMAIQMEDRYPIIDILEQTPTIPDNCQWGIFLRNHDELTLEMVTDEERDYMYRVYAADPRARINLGIRRRLAPLLGNNRRKIELINSLLFSLPGTPIIYYGDEIGMGDNFFLGDRNGVRTPMQWTPDRNAGFSRANPQQLYLPTIIDPEYHYESVNVENQQKNLSSLFWWMRRVLGVRKQFQAFARGTIEFLQPDNMKVLTYVRRHGDEEILAIANLSRFAQVVELDLSAFAGQVPEELFGHSQFPEIKPGPTVFTLGPHGFYWFLLKPATAAKVSEAAWTAPLLGIPAEWNEVLVRRIVREILPTYLQTCRWFGGKGRVLRELQIAQNLPLGSIADARLVIIEVTFTEGLPESYLLPLLLADKVASHSITTDTPHAVLAQFPDGRVLCDAMHSSEVRAELLRLTARKSTGRSRSRLVGVRSDRLEPEQVEKLVGHSRVIGADQSNTAVIYGDAWFLKIFRKFERGPNPDMDIAQFLSETRGFTHSPPFGGALKLSDPAGDGVLALVSGFTPNQGDGWTFSLDAVARYFDRVLESRTEMNEASIAELIGGVYPERARQLGQRTGELHLALAGGEDLADFAAEHYTSLYQRSLYQGVRGSAGRVLRQLRRQLSRLPEAVREEAAAVVAGQANLYAMIGELTSRKIPALRIRIHGDYHLGQVLNTGKDFVILDFEGEPRRSLGERVLKRSPLVDVAGMLRSFDYAASAKLRQAAAADIPKLEPWARVWVDAVQSYFLESYFATVAGASFLPPEPADVALLLRVFTLEKAIYEVGYELSYRPDFLPIPLGAVSRLLAEK